MSTCKLIAIALLIGLLLAVCAQAASGPFGPLPGPPPGPPVPVVHPNGGGGNGNGGNTVTALNARTLGAAGNGVADDYPVLQKALNTACNMSALGQTPPQSGPINALYLPAGAYLISQPLRPACGGVEWFGQGYASVIQPNFLGPAVLDEPYGANNLTLVSSLVSGLGNAMQLNDDSGASPALALTDVIGESAGQSLNGLAAFNIRFFFKPTEATQANGTYMILGSHPGIGDVSSNSAFQLYATGTGNTLVATATIGGSTKSVSGPALTLNTTYEIEFDYDGSNLRLFVGTPGSNTTLYGPTAATGTLTQDPIEIAMLPDFTSGNFPDVQNDINHAWAGVIDSIQISNESRHTVIYPAPTTKFSVDSHTMMLINFLTSGYIADGLQLVQTGIQGYGQFPGNYYLPVRGQNEGYGVARQYIHDLSFNAPFFAVWSWDSIFQHIYNQAPTTTYPLEIPGFDFYDNDFESVARDLFSTSYSIGFEYGLHDAESYVENNQVGVGDSTVCFISQNNGGLQNIIPACSAATHLIYGFLYNITYMLDTFPILITYFPNSVMRADYFMEGMNSAQIDMAQLQSANSAPFFDIYGGGNIAINGPTMQTGVSVPEAVHVISSPFSPVTIKNPEAPFGNITELTDSVKDVSTPGCMGTTTLSSGSGTISNLCITTGSIPTLVDLTNSGHTCTAGTLSNGSLAVTGTGTDVCKAVFQ